MKRVLFVVAAVLVAAVGVAYATGVGPAPGGDDATIESFPTETPASDGSGGGGATAGTPTDDGGGTAETTATRTRPPFTFAIERIEECGRTCRDVTSTLTNRQDATARNVTVYTRIFVGNGTDGDVVWSGKKAVGDLGPGESYTATERVELSLAEASSVKAHDGWVTVQTTVQTADRTVTYTRHRDVT
jgi:hypothetical protein